MEYFKDADIFIGW